MFPEDYYELEIDEETELVEESIELGRVPLYDFEKKEYVMRDGRVVEATKEESVLQWVAFLIKTELGKYDVYDGTEFGTSIANYINYRSNNVGFVISEIERELIEKAELNKAIEGIADFDAHFISGVLKCSLTVILKDETEVEVEIDVEG